ITGRHKVVVATEVDFTYRRTLRTYGRGPELEIIEVPTAKLASSAEGAACLIVQHPDAFGSLVDVRQIADAAHAAGALCVQVTEPHANALLEPPGALGVDIAVGEGQPLGITMSYGGPHLGIFACRESPRRAPGLRDRQRRSVLRSLHAAYRDGRMGPPERAHRAWDPGRGDRVALLRRCEADRQGAGAGECQAVRRWPPRGARRRHR